MRLVFRFAAVLAAVLAAAIALQAAAPAPSKAGKTALDLSAARVVDLTHSFDENTIYWPNSPSTFKLNRLVDGPSEAGFYYRMNSFCAPEHGGTHLDAPSHFSKDGWPADKIPISRLVARGVVLDVASKARANPDYRLEPSDVRDWETKHGAIAAGSIVLLRTGWGGRWPDRKRY